jgi:predicted DNA-binding transcriptional regulator AlpA
MNNASANDANTPVRLVPIEKVQAALANTSRANFYSRVNRGLLPTPVKFGKATTIPSNELDAIVAAHVRGASDSEIQQLVRTLHERRGVSRQNPTNEMCAA